MALPSISAVFDLDIPQTNIIVSEEETHSSSFSVYEKTIPKTLDVHDFIKFFESVSNQGKFEPFDDSIHLNHYLTIFPPPSDCSF